MRIACDCMHSLTGNSRKFIKIKEIVLLSSEEKYKQLSILRIAALAVIALVLNTVFETMEVDEIGE
jgi:hypothetical protein